MSQEIIVHNATPVLIQELIDDGYDIEPVKDPQGSVTDAVKDEDLEFIKENFSLVQIRELRRMGEFFKANKTWL